MPITVGHSLTATTPDNTSYEIRPSHWNQAHVYTLNATGTEISNAFSNANGISFGTSAGAITASYTVPTNYALSDHSHGNPTLALTNLSGTTASNSAGFTLSLSAGAGGAGDGVNILAAGTQTANTTGTVLFNNANGVSFGMNNSSVITASYSTLAAATNVNDVGSIGSTGTSAAYAPADHVHAGVIRVHAGSNTGNTAGNTVGKHGDWVIAGSNNVTINGSTGAGGIHTVWVSGPTLTPYLTTAALSDHSHGNPTLALTNLSGTTASNSAGFTLSLSAGAGGAGDGVNILAAGSQTANTTGTVAFVNSNGITFGMSNSSQITASHNGLTSQSNQAVSGANGSFTFQTLSFANSNGVSWSTGTQGFYATVKTDYLTTAALSDHSHGNPTLALTNLTGTTASNSAGFTLSLSANAPGAAAENNNMALLGANTAGNTTASGSTIGFSGINMTLSGTNGSVINLSVPATSSLSATGIVSISTNGSTISIGAAATTLSNLYLPEEDFIANLSAHANGTMSVQNRMVPTHVTASRIVVPVNISSVATAANASSAGINFSISFAIYSMNGATLASMSSGSFSTGATWSSNATGSVTGGVLMSAPFNMNMTPGDYWFGMNMSTAATGGTLTGAATTSLGNTISVIGFASQNIGAFSWHTLGSSTNQSIGYVQGEGLYTGTTAFSGPQWGLFSHQGTAAQRAKYALYLEA